MPTLTNRIRKEILEKLMKRSDFDARKKALQDEERAIGDQLIREAFTDKEWKAIKDLSPEYFQDMYEIRVQVAGSVTELKTNRWRKPYNMSRYKIHQVIDAGTPKCIKIQTMLDSQADLKKEIESAGIQANAILESCTTTKGLIKAWPEIKALVEPYEIKKDYLLAVTPQAVNNVFKLPVEERPAPAVQGKTAKTPKGKRAQK